MTNILIQPPFEFFTDRTGRALANGRIYIGLPNQDPENFPQNVFFDVVGNTPATQPVRTNVAGYPSDTTGNPQRIFTPGAYSIRVRDSNGVQVFYAADNTDGFYGVAASDLANNTNPALGSGMVGYVYDVGATGTTVHDKFARTVVDIKDFGAVGDGVTNDKAAFDAAASTGRSILLPAGDYNVPSGDYGDVRFYSFDGATSTNGTIAIVDPLANSLAVGTMVGFPCTPINLPFGWIHRNGQTLNRSVYPQLWAFADASGNIVDEVDKPNNKSAFGRGNGTSTFSVPDDRATNPGFSDDGAGINATFVLGKQPSISAAAAPPGITIISSISTPAIRAFAAQVNQGNIDIQALQASVLALQALYARTSSTAWGTFNGVPLNGTYTQSGTGITVTMTAHAMTVGMHVRLDFTTGTAVDGGFTVVTVPTANTFTVTASAPLTTSGNVTRQLYIKDSFNISTITDGGVGIYNVLFTLPMVNANFAAIPNGSNTWIVADTPALAGFRFTSRTAAGALVDEDTAMFSVFGGKV